MIEDPSQIQGHTLSPGESFSFRCHAGLACFNSCCRDKRLPLLPYDALRLRRHLDLGSAEFLDKHATLETDPTSGWPALRLALREEGRCPFVGADGCTVYEHRPTCCRVYPLARAVRPRPGAADEFEELFIAGDTPACLGWQEERVETIEHWVEDQGLDPYQQANNLLPRLLLHPRRGRPMELDPRQIHGYLLALYNLDLFRELVASDGFGARFNLSPDRVQAALADEEALLALGISWLVEQFFG